MKQTAPNFKGTLQVNNPHLLTYQTDLLTIDILGGVEVMQLDRMVCTLRVSFADYPPLRTTLDLYNDNQTDKLLRTICDKWELKLLEVSKTVHTFITELEKYKLERLHYPQKGEVEEFEISEEQQQVAEQYLKDKNLITNLKTDFHSLGILENDDNALILFMAMASHKLQHPFSVLCLSKNENQLISQLSECMPKGSFSYHTHISENALYYFDSNQLNGKALFVEDLEWTNEMLLPLATLQTGGRLVKTRATKNKDGLLHSTTFKVQARLCLIASSSTNRNYSSLNLPFLLLDINHSHTQNQAIMDYTRKCKAGLIDENSRIETQQKLQNIIASLNPIKVINPFAQLIELPSNLPHNTTTLSLLLDFIEVVTYFHQRQRTERINEQTGELYIETTFSDIELAFSLLKNSLLLKSDELSAPTRNFFEWLKTYLQEVRSTQFTALDIRKAKQINPRTLNRYLQELTLFNYLQITGGNKYRGGFIYRLTDLKGLQNAKNDLESCLTNILAKITTLPTNEPQQVKQSITKPTNDLKDKKPEATTNAEPTFFDKHYKRIRINEKEQHTFKLLLELEAKEPNREYLADDITALSSRSKCMEARYLKVLWEQGKLNRTWKNRQYHYSLIK